MSDASPSRSAQSAVDRDAAVEWAQTVRARRAQVLGDLGAGRTDLMSVLDHADADPLVAAIKLLKVLEALPGARKTDTRRALADLGVDGQRRLGELSIAEVAAVRETFPLARDANPTGRAS